MNVTASQLLEELPPYRDEWVMVKKKQKVEDIIELIQGVHVRYSDWYDKIALKFDDPSVKRIAEKLYNFCKKNIRYEEEPESVQTSGLPTGILTRQYGDCKHYASFCGGCLDAISRLTGKNIDWCYRFACYKSDRDTPHHVFVVVNDNGQEYWLDPTPEANDLTPLWYIDREIKVAPMPLYENIGSVEPYNGYFPSYGYESFDFAQIGKASLKLLPYTGSDNNLNFEGTNNKYAGSFDPYLGLSMYRDFGGDRNLNKTEVANQLNQLIAGGPSPGHTIDPDFVEWVYNTNLRSWNFYYPGGVRPGFTAEHLLPVDKHVIITDDGRLTLNTDQKLDDYRNAEIHLITAWVQALVNEYDPSPYPVKPEHIKIHSQMKEGNINTRNLFTEARGDSIFKEIGKTLEGVVNFVKDGVFKIVGSIPRNAYLVLTGLNAFNMASSQWKHIQAGQWDEMANKWKSIGGNPDKLYNTIQNAKDKNAVLGNAIGEVATATTFLAAAAPIIAVMLKFLDKDGKITQALSAAKGFLQTKYPDLDLDAYGFLDKKTGQPIQWVVDDRDNELYGGGNNDLPVPSNNKNNFMNWFIQNPIPSAGLVGVGTLLITRKKGRKPNMLLAAGAAVVTYFLLTREQTLPGPATSGTKKAALIQWVQNTGDAQSSKDYVVSVFNKMPDSEINIVYDYIFNYVIKNTPVPESSALYNQVLTISDKYQIFT